MANPKPPSPDPEAAEEYLRLLQRRIDRLIEDREWSWSRITKLARDRETLRQRAAELKDKLTEARQGKRGSLRGDIRPESPPPISDRAADTPPSPDRSLEIPGVGHIDDLSFPEVAPRRPDLTVATILDAFSNSCFAPEFDNLALSAANWKEALEQNSPQFLFVESAYEGLDGTWATRVARFGEPSGELNAVVQHCRALGIPTVFWNKEDPINFDWFSASASLFDIVLTVDGESLDRYRGYLPDTRVEHLGFAAQPAIHHPPADSSLRTGAVAFSGTYYAKKHEQRRQQMEMILDPARGHGLQIFDRMGELGDDSFSWPERFAPHIVGSLTYPQTCEIYRRYRWTVNINTVIDSPTMCARRVFEVLASGGHVLSGPSLALDRLQPPGVTVCRDPSDAEAALSDPPTGENREGVGWIEAGHTYSHRVERILELI